MARLQDIFVYPVKSAAALAQASARVAPRGLEGDRRWLVVDADGVFQTGRQLPASPETAVSGETRAAFRAGARAARSTVRIPAAVPVSRLGTLKENTGNYL